MSRKLQVSIPELVCITVTGPVQSGKSSVLHRIKRVLEEEFGATVHASKDLEETWRVEDYSSPADWEVKMVGENIWHLQEGSGDE